MLGGLIKGDGKAELNWTNEYLFVESNFNIFDGLITTQTDFLARWENQFELYLFGEAKVLMPHFVPLWGGTKSNQSAIDSMTTTSQDLSQAIDLASAILRHKKSARISLAKGPPTFLLELFA